MGWDKLVDRSLLCAAFILGCADDGSPDYSSHVGLVPPDVKGVEPDPFEPGDERLSVGWFYESGRSDEVELNGATRNWFIFVTDINNPATTLTATQATSGDRLEGPRSDALTLLGTPFWGAGIIWDNAIDLSDWTTLHVSFKSSDPSFASFELTLQSGDDAAGVVINPTSYGYTNDGQWHTLQIPIQDVVNRGFDPSRVRSPFIVGGPGGQAGDVLFIDNLYMTKE